MSPLVDEPLIASNIDGNAKPVIAERCESITKRKHIIAWGDSITHGGGCSTHFGAGERVMNRSAAKGAT